MKRDCARKIKCILGLVATLALIGLVWASKSQAAEVTLQWDPVADASGYNLYLGVWDQTSGTITWDAPIDAGTANQFTHTSVREDVLVFFRVSAYDSGGNESIRTESGSWYNHAWAPMSSPDGLGINR